MNPEDSTNLEILKVPNVDGFYEELEASPETLHYSQSREFFEILLNYFQQSIDEETGNLILYTIAKVLCNDRHLDVFIKENFALQLPYRQRMFQDSVFEIIFVLVSLGPHCFDDSRITKQFAPLIKRNPKKSLTILAIYAQKFAYIENPWPMVDLLIQESQRFIGPELAANYVSLLTTLCIKYEDYCQGRAEHCWRKICALLNETDIMTLKVVYCGLCNISKVYTGGELPIDPIRAHLRVKDLQRPVLTLLISVPLHGEESCDRPLLQTLCSLSERDDKATMVLMKASSDPVFADFLVENAKLWLGKELPTPIETLRLFLSVFKFKELRQTIAESPDFYEFLKMITNQENGNSLSMLCTIIRRIELNEQIISNLSDSGFLRAFFAMAADLNTTTSKHSALLMLDTISRIAYSREFMKMCDMINDIINERGELTEVAILVAAELCTYKKCELAFKRKRLDEYIKTLLVDPQLKRPAQKFLDSIS
ncbi:hypothetical protein TVAG_089000 [Trichomonas vaginalis G3]|uniref:Uncharacterized protein n=1 Tax=Trichomonas vaginalis (strain ATCC PRA-98 / G3) TaxID=412133 RepID=A2G3L6_TRIV3|nr:protein kinase protein [Trichomonas vaginalis G3]EAX88252.1 hypothetical protein TVAG_089000 [Trichomonas vaginalis G3]KAI5488049.1 protein kinase protein [Trichomonas vaginalis G3]|eukprot:XP_001301182.1 hypothetical protein [Trichomonas vaginalis G3]